MMDYDADHRLTARVVRARRYWRWIALGTALSGLAAFTLSLFLPKVYRATTYILVSESKIGRDTYTGNSPYYSTLPTYIPFVDNDMLISRAIKEFHLDQPPYNLTVSKFQKGDYLDVRIPKSTSLLELDLEFPDAQLAAHLANYLAQGAVDFNYQMNAADTVASRKFLKQHLDEVTTLLSEAEQRRLSVREKAKIEDREKQLAILLGEKEKISNELQQLRVALAQDRGRTQALEQALKGEPRTLQLTKSLTDDRFLERAAEKTGSESTKPLAVTEETPNPARQKIQEDYANASANGAAEKAGVEAAGARLQQIDEKVTILVGELTRLRSLVETADHEVLLAREAVETATRGYQNASVTVTSKSQDLKQLSPALVPERPVRPRILLNTLLGFLLGFLVLSGLAMALESYRATESEVVRFAEEGEHLEIRRD